MTERRYTHALGKLGMARLYDPILAVSGDRKWRARVVDYLAPKPGEIIVDVGSGTGSLAVRLAQAQPDARIIGIDPDQEMQTLAREKAAQKGAQIDWRLGMGDELVTIFGVNSVDKLTSSLVLHQCPMPMKRAILAAMTQVVRPGGTVVIADFGLQRTRLMRWAFRIVQWADGKEDTQPNADGILPTLMREAGLTDVHEAQVFNTLTGSISIYLARK